MEKKTPIKKEYTTYWSQTDVFLRRSLSYTPDRHFGSGESVSVGKNNQVARELIFPDEIPFRDLSLFLGRKTKITIEVLDE